MSGSTNLLLDSLPQRLSGIPERWAQQTPEAIALCQDGVAFTFQQLAQASIQAAQWLRDSGVRPGDRLMVVAENCIAQIVLIFAAARIDAWIVNVNARLSAAEVDAIGDHSQPRRIIYTVSVSAEARAHAERGGALAHQLTGVGEIAVGALNETCSVEPVCASGSEQVAALIYTTGTTGLPKGVMLTHRNLLFIAASSSQVRGLVPGDRAYGVLPITHVFGLASVALGTLYAGATLYLAARYSPAALLQAIRDDKLTIIQGVPAMYARLLEYDKGRQDLAQTSLRFIYAGGSPLDSTLKLETERLFGRTLHNGYGMTESSPTISQTRLDAPRSDTSVGSVIPGVEARIVDSQGADLPQDEPGELWVRGPNVMKGYYRDEALTARTIDAQGWLNTGDLVRQDSDGALFLIGRSKELIIRSGFNVYPIEVEAALNAHPAVAQSAVVGRPGHGGNEEVVAFVELDPTQPAPNEQSLHDWLVSRLSPYKRPSQIVVMQAMPAAATGKILKGQLKELAQRLLKEELHPEP
ncbi:class I adenylate-forming enzyme family protein [Pollutimonas harenae]|uniref:Acyl--CoA ligase n=1 Tax=Pollutimonas harenae TaxID=657015 RepID=A0A853H0J4_9BURK|nr:class I adenylate-forming enzyme family protein [Pollutimonas harenae]NYT85239.1 acyl--CoA ligase [Pollutimonas harenae]TEA72391.1 long-chain fatty acid--CoA ligase [Pollutimonas harenae]